MKKFICGAVLAAIFIIAVPMLVIWLTGGVYTPEGEKIKVYIASLDRVEEMSLEEYVLGAVCAEMPAEFEEEALKAQAVASRSYTINKIKKGGNEEEHKGAVICTDYKHCQAWCDINERKKDWENDKAEEYERRIKKAVEETRGEVLTYNGEVINALFHSVSSGMTEAAADVWGADTPYLTARESKADEGSPKFYTEKQMSTAEFINIFKGEHSDADENAALFSEIQRSPSGGIKTVKILGVTVAGTEMRRIFELRSTNAELCTENENVIIKTKGNGHGVGMSQYGANFMAKDGKSYKEITEHYYYGAKLSQKGY